MDEKRNYRGEAEELILEIAKRRRKLKFLIGRYVYNTFPKNEDDYAVVLFSDETSYPNVVDTIQGANFYAIACRADKYGEIQLNNNFVCGSGTELDEETWFDEYDDFIIDYEQLLGVLENAEYELREGK